MSVGRISDRIGKVLCICVYDVLGLILPLYELIHDEYFYINYEFLKGMLIQCLT